MTHSTLRLRAAAPFFALALLGAGCFGGSTAPATGPNGGVWKSVDKGVTWTNKKKFVSGPTVTNGGATFNILSMAFDPQDQKTVYLATAENGVIFTLDAGESWQQGKIAGVTRVNAIAVDPKNKCTVYAASANKIYKTETCARDWTQIYFEPRAQVSFTRLIVDWYNPTILYAGTSDGDVVKSVDSGIYWQKIKRVDGIAITGLILDKKDSRILYVATDGDGVWKSPDAGNTWNQIKKVFAEEYRDARKVTQLIEDPVEDNVLYLVSKYGIIRSADGGDTWKALILTSPPGTVKINAMAIDPKNNKNIIYTGISTLQFSTDGGVTWAPKKLPTTQVGSSLLIDPMNSDVIYLGTKAPPAQQN